MILRLSLELPEEHKFVSLTRRLGTTTLEYLNVSKQDIDDVEIVLGELTSNVIRHANSVEGCFELVLEYHATRIVVIVRDKGTGFSRDKVAAPGTERPDEDGDVRLGGYGLGLVEALSDKLQFTTTDAKGTTVVAEKTLTYANASDARYAAEMNENGGATGEVTARFTSSSAS